MELVILAGILITAVVVGVLARRKSNKNNDFEVCWASSGWRSCYGKNANLARDEDGQVYMNMTGPQEPHYIVKPHGDISGRKQLVVSYRVDVLEGEPFFYAVDAAGSDTPATASAFFQRKGDDMYAKGNKQYYRWWSLETLPLTPGVHTFVVPLDVDENAWTSVWGKKPAAAPQSFWDAQKNCRQIGLTFGGGGGRGHGIRVKGGKARLTITGAWVE